MANPLSTVLPWERMTRWRYHLEKAAHSALAGVALFALTPLDLLLAMVAGAALYLLFGKLTVGRSHHPTPWLELLDWLADLIIGLFGAALAVWSVYGLEAGLIAVGVWTLLYSTLSHRFAIP